MRAWPADAREETGLAGSPRWDLALLLLLGAHLVWVFAHFLPVAVGPDAGGLFPQARLLATELTTGFRPESPLQFLGSHWIETGDGDFHSRYPPGLPLLLAGLYALGGPKAPFFLNPILATAIVGLTYLAGRRWLGRGPAFWAALLVAALPILNRLALHGDAHPGAAALVLLGVWLLLRWDDEPRARRAFLAGLVFGLIPTVRYPDAVVGLGVLAFFLARRRDEKAGPGFLWASAGAGFPLVALGAYNARTYGAPWRTGYGFTNEQSAFGLTYFSNNLPTYLEALLTGGAGLLVILGTVGMAWMVARRESRARGLLLMGSTFSLTLLYTAYYWGRQEEAELTLRYFLAALPLFALAGLWLVQRLPSPRVSWGFLALASVLHLAWNLPRSRESLLEEWLGLARGRAVVEVATRSIPGGAVVVARREVQDMLDYYGQWRLMDDALLPGTPAHEETTLVWELTPRERARLAELPTPVQITKAVEARARYAGLSRNQLAEAVLEDLWKWNGSREEAFWLGQPSTVEAFLGLAPEALGAEPMEEVELPGWGMGLALPAWVPKAPMVLYRLQDAEPGSSW